MAQPLPPYAMYHSPEIDPFRMGQPLAVTDLLADGVSLEAAYARLPADLRCDCDPELDEHLPWRRPAAVLRELHRTRAAQILAARPCPACAERLAAELLVPVAHPSEEDRTVTLLDSLLDLVGELFELVAGRQPLHEVVDRYVGEAADPIACRMPGCPGARTGDGRVVAAFSISVLGLLASWAYEAGLSRDTEPMISAAWTEVLDDIADSPEGSLMSSTEMLDLAGIHPRVVAAETHVPAQWADSDWGSMGLLRGESPTLTELRDELGVSAGHAAVCVVQVANWLADRVGDALAG